MFDVYCPNHGSRVLLFSSDIEAVRNIREGIEVHYRCFCGHRGVPRERVSLPEPQTERYLVRYEFEVSYSLDSPDMEGRRGTDLLALDSPCKYVPVSLGRRNR